MPAKRRRLNLSVQRALAGVDTTGVPTRALFLKWARAALSGSADITVRLVGTAEARNLNRDYRGKDYATNVLSFAYNEGDEGLVLPPGTPLSGDLVLCVPVVAAEAAGQGKLLVAHYAHLMVHGMLHLQGYDHQTDEQAADMEALEREILGALGFDDPYADT